MSIKTQQEEKIDKLSSYIGKLVYVKSLKTKLEIVDLEIEEKNVMRYSISKRRDVYYTKNIYWFRVRVPGRDHKPTRIKATHVVLK